ncbi:MAG: hypothetical protein JKY34_11245 [Kordiimonadaceae bacterium]|nr:hypothetical protein [Kordiimonadaceae bacterium]
MPDSSPDKEVSAVITVEGLFASFENEGLSKYLVDSQTVREITEAIAEEFPIAPYLAKFVFRNLLRFVGWVIRKSAAKGVAWLIGKVFVFVLKLFTKIPWLGPKALERLAGVQVSLSKSVKVRRELDCILDGSATTLSAEAAKSFSAEFQLDLKQYEKTIEILEIVKGVKKSLKDDSNPQPPLEIPLVEDIATTRLRFAARHIPFLGREGEMAQLSSFCDCADQFSWWLVIGSGGLGKSRLALEFCLTKRETWQVGFLSDHTTFDKWEKWQPDRPTLIVVDYVAKRAELIGDMLAQLNSRSDLECPVRVLLLERHKDDVWWDQMVPNTSEGLALAQSQFDTMIF